MLICVGVSLCMPECVRHCMHVRMYKSFRFGLQEYTLNFIYKMERKYKWMDAIRSVKSVNIFLWLRNDRENKSEIGPGGRRLGLVALRGWSACKLASSAQILPGTRMIKLTPGLFLRSWGIFSGIRALIQKFWTLLYASIGLIYQRISYFSLLLSSSALSSLLFPSVSCSLHAVFFVLIQISFLFLCSFFFSLRLRKVL